LTGTARGFFTGGEELFLVLGILFSFRLGPLVYFLWKAIA
jgi:hypothetical protein